MGRVKGLLFDLLRKKKGKKQELRCLHCLSWQKAVCLILCPLALYPGTWHSWDTPFLHFSQQVAHSCHCYCLATYLLETWDNLAGWSLHAICVECRDFKGQHFGVIMQHFIAATVWDCGAVGPSLLQVGWQFFFEQLDLAAFHPKVLLDVWGPLVFLSTR